MDLATELTSEAASRVIGEGVFAAIWVMTLVAVAVVAWMIDKRRREEIALMRSNHERERQELRAELLKEREEHQETREKLLAAFQEAVKTQAGVKETLDAFLRVTRTEARLQG